MTHGHAAELGLGELVVADGLAEHDAVVGVLAGRLVGGLHHADGPGRGLQPAVLEAGHLVVEALAQAALEADQVGGRHEPVVEGDLVGVHAAVADGVDRAALHLPAAGRRRRPASWVNSKPWPSPRGLGTMNMRQAAVALRPVGVGAGQQHAARRRGRRTCTTSSRR